VKVGAAEKTRLPVPVSFVIDDARRDDAAVVVALLCASTKSARDAVWLESLRIPEIVVDESVGAVPKTKAPDPVSFVSEFAKNAEVAVVVALLDASKNNALDAV
jgi:hypothetical protein